MHGEAAVGDLDHHHRDVGARRREDLEEADGTREDALGREDDEALGALDAQLEQVAEVLMGKAKTEYLKNRKLSKMGDDTTVMVVDLNPSHLAFSSRGGTGCCVLA